MIRAVTALVLFAFTVSGVAGDQPDSVTVARAMVDAINQRDLEGLDAWVAEDVVRHSAATPGVVVTNIDDDSAGITVTRLVAVSDETGAQASFSVVLNSEPTADVTVNFRL